jgi:N-acetylmuramoyl-L-alanine amidase
MASARAIRRRLLKEAVEENYATIFGRPAPQVRRRRVRRRVGRVALVVVAFIVTSALSFALADHEFRRAVPDVPAVAVVAPSPAVRIAAPPRPVLGAPDPSFDAASTSPLDRSVFPFSVRRVAIDPGHGGEHSGATSSRGVMEKTITLDLAGRLAELLSAAGFETFLTRQGDETMSLDERGDLANQQRADIFVSIHVNWFSEAHVRALETFYLGPTDDEYLQRLAARENLDSSIPLGDFRRALERVYADVRRGESRQLADSVQHELIKSLRTINPWLEDRGVKSAPFGVLIRTEMPAILTEVGCLSNEEEAQLLESAAYRQFLAEAIFAGVRSYALGLNPNLIVGS